MPKKKRGRPRKFDKEYNGCVGESMLRLSTTIKGMILKVLSEGIGVGKQTRQLQSKEMGIQREPSSKKRRAEFQRGDIDRNEAIFDCYYEDDTKEALFGNRAQRPFFLNDSLNSYLPPHVVLGVKEGLKEFFSNIDENDEDLLAMRDKLYDGDMEELFEIVLEKPSTLLSDHNGESFQQVCASMYVYVCMHVYACLCYVCM
jgi:hypothetical protein